MVNLFGSKDNSGESMKFTCPWCSYEFRMIVRTAGKQSNCARCPRCKGFSKSNAGESLK